MKNRAKVYCIVLVSYKVEKFSSVLDAYNPMTHEFQEPDSADLEHLATGYILKGNRN